MTTTHHPPSHWLALSALVICWGSAFLFTAFALQGFSALQIASGRIISGALVLVAVMLWLRVGFAHSRRHWLYFLAMGVSGNCLPFMLIAWGQQYVPSGEAGIVMAMVPLLVMVLAHFTLPSERLTRRRIAGFLTGFAGVVVLLGPQHLGSLFAQEAQLARLALLAATASYAVAAVLAQYQPNRNLVQSAAGTLITASLVMTIALALSGDLIPPARLELGPSLALFALGLMSTGAANLVYFWLAPRAGAGFLSLSNYLVPCLAVVLGVLFVGERLAAGSWLALALILAGLALCQRRAGSVHQGA